LIKFLRSYYPDMRLFIILVIISALFVIGFFAEIIFYFANFVLISTLILAIYEIIRLFSVSAITASRILPEKLSNADENLIQVNIVNHYKFNIICELVDEIPIQFQKRDFSIIKHLSSGNQETLSYSLRPTERGNYIFGNLNIFVSTKLGLGKRRYTFSGGAEVPTYPSFLRLKHYEMIAISNKLVNPGIKEVRKLGHSMEFEHVRDYRTGDDYRTINWKATARKSELMVNQYIDERSQNIFSVIDMGRNMKMPFAGLTLLDYSINSALAMSSIILKKYDKAGLLTFSKDVHSFLPALNHTSQMPQIMEMLYRAETNFVESSFEHLYSFIRRKIPHRSLLMIYTNFETLDSMRRNLEYLKLIAKFHLPLVIFFDNTEVSNMLTESPKKTFDIYKKVSAEQYMIDKYEIINELRANGIMSMISKPENLTLDSINKYLEIKSRRII
jgi:uncharacterized protein (DUF58 family)